ncbi:helix-turn-helix domain-containing protein [Yoonia litorea]|uniref:Regulatory helix-turn-helix protein, lysR family n=1 Tax=Yoonia litorea TaxID=1123755 RepID=A0A1I6MLP9_9RHOB|nr:LysR family transcriptional regulator [Yoonia litorea]SFS16602.1 regulatory helix-turn-helix protein, lysR family [Yoonia litorea]
MNQSKANSGVSVAMIRAFVCVSKHLNISQACLELRATRQTVRRHINDLEFILGGDLFEVVDRQYQLTSFGAKMLEGAKSLLTQIDAWSGQSPLTRHATDGLESQRYTDAQGRVYYSQQHPVSQIAREGLPLMKQAFKAWGTAETQIDHEAMDAIRPYAVLYRKSALGWVYVHVGEESAYARWLGPTIARSVIGRLISDDSASEDYDEFMGGAYSRIYEEGGVRFDHILAHMPRESGETKAGSFQRLLMGGVFPDGTHGLIIIAALTENIVIDALCAEDRPKLPECLLMDRVLQSAD